MGSKFEETVKEIENDQEIREIFDCINEVLYETRIIDDIEMLFNSSNSKWKASSWSKVQRNHYNAMKQSIITLLNCILYDILWVGRYRQKLYLTTGSFDNQVPTFPDDTTMTCIYNNICIRIAKEFRFKSVCYTADMMYEITGD